jgi:hypothetical protein
MTIKQSTHSHHFLQCLKKYKDKYMIDRLKLTQYRFRLDTPENFEDVHGNHPIAINTLSPRVSYDTPKFGKFEVYFFKSSRVVTTSGYTPNLTIKISPNSRNPYQLVIEWSPNKAVFGHNFYELGDHQFSEMIAATVALLDECGVSIDTHYLAQSDQISQIDYGININIHTMKANDFMGILNVGFDKNSRYGKDPEQYQKTYLGYRITYHNKSQRLTFYNKVAHILSAIEEAQPGSAAHNFAEQLQPHFTAKPLEVLRVEHKILKHTAKDRELCKLIGHSAPFTVQELFNSNVRAAVLRKHITHVLGSGKCKTYVLGELELTAIKSHLSWARYAMHYRKLQPIWYEYPVVFRRQGEAAAKALISGAMPQATAERGMKRWQHMMKMIDLEHPLLKIEAEIYNRLADPQPIIQI